MKVAVFVAVLTLMFSLSCGDDVERPPEVEVFFGEMEVTDLLVPEPDLATKVDTVVFTVEGNQYRLDHNTDNSGLCSSGGTVGNFGRNFITLTRLYVVPKGPCNEVHIPEGMFKAAYPGDSLILGPDTIEYIVIENDQEFRDSLCFTFLLSK